MNKYIFLLGQSSDLARQELVSFFSSNEKIEQLSNNFAIISTKNELSNSIKYFGGTIKMAKYIESLNDIKQLDEKKWFDILENKLASDKKNNFGFSLYNNKSHYKDIAKLAMSLKKNLKNKGFKVRLVSSKEPILSSVIVSKNNVLGKELIIIFDNNKIHLGLTEEVQDFKSYGQRDAYRPNTDSTSGMLPPKVAQMMINVAQKNNDAVLLDPFCGSGTVLQEAALLGFKKVIGSDKSEQALSDTKNNIKWLRENFSLNTEFDIKKIDARHLDQKIDKKVDCIVSEPYMGNARLIQKTSDQNTLQQIINELQQLYLETFKQFQKILSDDGRIVFVFPIFQLKKNKLYTLDKKILAKIDFKLLKPDLESNELSDNGNIIYMRPGQKVLREITIWKK